MPRKESTGLCLFFDGNHYCFPMGKEDHSPRGDIYWFFGKDKGYISFHPSKKIHYTDENKKRTTLNEIGSNKLYYKVIKNLFEPFNDLTNSESEFWLNLGKFIDSSVCFDGCFNLDCKNRAGWAFNFDKLMELTVEYFNKYKEQFFQIFGPIENTFDPEEIEEENNENNSFNVILASLKIEKIPECQYCIDKNKIQFKKKRFVWVKCPRCGGLGLELEKLEEYKTY